MIYFILFVFSSRRNCQPSKSVMWDTQMHGEKVTNNLCVLCLIITFKQWRRWNNRNKGKATKLLKSFNSSPLKRLIKWSFWTISLHQSSELTGNYLQTNKFALALLSYININSHFLISIKKHLLTYILTKITFKAHINCASCYSLKN